MRNGTKTPEAIAEDVGAMMSRIWLTEDADGILPLHEAWKQGHQMGKLCLVVKVCIFNVPIGLHTNKIGHMIGHLKNDCEVAFHIKEIGGTVIQCFGPWLKVELENLWCLDNIDELDVAFSDNSWPLFNEKDKDVEVNSRPNHLLDDSIGQNNPINIEHNGGSHPDEGAKECAPLSQEFGSIRGENRKGGGLGGGKWKRLDRSFENSSIKDRDKHGKRNLQSTLVVEERALKVLVDNSGVVVS
ncbi:hypothetical protein SLEP1_g35685 [Rubroshorea leprosula]|uniref:Uncharacterized protein n=1 Tax=Rubroshorea leprosula TaxID=152421 RepID=A0AAV5KP82_9ROSI|nr:hypothetical protein SLEP1_g35685 [Rubroshorea leprosula]